MTNETLLEVKEVAHRLAVPVKTVYSWCNSGKIPHCKLGKHLRFSQSDIEAWIKKNKRGPKITVKG